MTYARRNAALFGNREKSRGCKSGLANLNGRPNAVFAQRYRFRCTEKTMKPRVGKDPGSKRGTPSFHRAWVSDKESGRLLAVAA